MSTPVSYMPLFSGRARIITHVTGWLFVFVTFFYLISSVRGTEEAFARSFVNVLFMMALFYGNAKFIVNRYVETGRMAGQAWLVVALWLGTTAFRTAVEIYGFGNSLLIIDNRPDIHAWRLFLGYGISFFLLLVFSTLYQLVENRRAIELQNRELEARHTEAQLNYLKAQINPHFLFNTLNNIYAAASLQHPRTADMVLRLSDLLRYVTYDAQAAQVPLDKEIDHIRAYLDLFQLKSESPLPIQFEVEGDTKQRMIEPVLLLPLVENALKHGDFDTNPTAFLRIKLENKPEHLVFTVENSFDPADTQKDETGGVGLENVRQRLALNYPGRFAFQATAKENIFTAILEIR